MGEGGGWGARVTGSGAAQNAGKRGKGEEAEAEAGTGEFRKGGKRRMGGGEECAWRHCRGEGGGGARGRWMKVGASVARVRERL